MFRPLFHPGPFYFGLSITVTFSAFPETTRNGYVLARNRLFRPLFLLGPFCFDLSRTSTFSAFPGTDLFWPETGRFGPCYFQERAVLALHEQGTFLHPRNSREHICCGQKHTLFCLGHNYVVYKGFAS